MSTRPFNIAVACNPDTCTIKLSGEIDFSASSQLCSQLQTVTRLYNRNVLLDMGAVTHIDSEGLKMLLGIAQQVKLNSGTTRIVNCSNIVRRILTLLGLDQILGLPEIEPIEQASPGPSPGS